MPHVNALAALKAYGPLAIELNEASDSLEAISQFEHRSEWEKRLRILLNVLAKNPSYSLLTSLSHDKYGYNRELAALVISQMWESWKLEHFDNARTTDDYVNTRRLHANDLAWTLPLLDQLLSDKLVGPVEITLRIAPAVRAAGDEAVAMFRRHLLTLGNSQSAAIRLLVVRYLTVLYPNNDDALSLLDDEGLALLINATYDPAEKIRDWACFELWLGVENLDERAEKAFNDAFIREDPTRDVHMEAIIGLARLGDERMTPLICNNLARHNFGPGWVDAVEQSRQADCLLALINAYETLVVDYPNDHMIETIERVLMDWND